LLSNEICAKRRLGNENSGLLYHFVNILLLKLADGQFEILKIKNQNAKLWIRPLAETIITKNDTA